MVGYRVYSEEQWAQVQQKDRTFQHVEISEYYPQAVYAMPISHGSTIIEVHSVPHYSAEGYNLWTDDNAFCRDLPTIP